MSDYYTGKYLNAVPTGFGGYTGLVLTNSGNFGNTYTASISNTTLLGVSAGDIQVGANTNTLFISTEKTTDDISINTAEINIDPGSSGVFYILHRPFTQFVAGHESVGSEKASITIETTSSNGDSDLPILVDITGQRVFDNPVPSRIGSFYAVKGYTEATQYQLDFYWNSLSPTNYVKGFEIGLYYDSSFSSLASSYTYNVPINTDANKPRYGDYDGFIDKTYNLKFVSLSLGQNYYARIRGVNFENEYGPYSYPTGYSFYNPLLSKVGIQGLYPSPGDNLKSDSTLLYLNRVDDIEENFDIYQFIKKNNNNSADFRKYSGVYIKFDSSSNNLCRYVATTTASGAFNFIVPNTDSFMFAADANDNFTIILELNNTAVLGKGGEGAKFNLDGSFSNPTNGGPCLNFDSYTYNGKTLQYKIYKDLDSILYGGAGGGKGWLITDDTTKNINNVQINGATVDHSTLPNLKFFNQIQ